MTPTAILIVGEDPALIDFAAPGAPKGVTAETITGGLNGARDRLEAAGHAAEILWTRAGGSAQSPEEGAKVSADQLSQALKSPPAGKAAWDVVVIGAGLRTLPPLALAFEAMIEVLRVQAPGTKVAFNANPADSDVAALRWVT